MEENAITALPLAGDQSVGFGIWSLIADADPVVKLVLLLLVLASLWSWTVIFDKALRYRPPAAPLAGFRARLLVRRAARRSVPPARRQGRPSDGDAVRRRHGGVARRAAARPGRRAERPAAADRQGHGPDPGARAGDARAASQLARDDRLDRALRRPVRHGLGHHEQLPVDRADQEHHARRGGARHRRGAVRDRARPGRRGAGGGGLQQALRRPRPLRQPGVELRRRVRGGALARAGERARAPAWRRLRAA